MDAALRDAGLKIAGSAAFGGTSFWIEGPARSRCGLADERFAQGRRADRIRIPFFPQDDGPCRYFRMGYSSIARNRIADGVALTATRIAERG